MGIKLANMLFQTKPSMHYSPHRILSPLFLKHGTARYQKQKNVHSSDDNMEFIKRKGLRRSHCHAGQKCSAQVHKIRLRIKKKENI